MGKYPFIASIQDATGFHFCGGSIIARRFILTAAHCMVGESASGVRVVVGRHKLSTSIGSRLSVKAITIHPSYDADTQQNDAAIIELTADVPASLTPVTLNAGTSNEAAGLSTTVIGWGALTEGGSSPDALQEVNVNVIATSTCNSNYGGGITSDMMCGAWPGGGRDSCQGDSGGPFFVSSGGVFVQTGVVSWGEGCARPNLPGVYARVSVLRAWIVGVAGITTNPTPSALVTATATAAAAASRSRTATRGVAPPPGGVVATDAFASRPIVSMSASSGDATATADTTTATRQSGEPMAVANSGESASVWVGVSSSSTGVMVVSVADAGFDSVLAVYRVGTNTLAGLTQLASNDDCGSGVSAAFGTSSSCVKVYVTAGSSYAIQMSGFGAARGLATLSLTLSA